MAGANLGRGGRTLRNLGCAGLCAALAAEEAAGEAEKESEGFGGKNFLFISNLESNFPFTTPVCTTA